MTGPSLAPRANLTTAENPWPLSLLTSNVKKYVDKMSELWVQGQVVEYSPRGSSRMSFFTLRDVDEDVSMRVTAFAGSIVDAGAGFEEGARIVARVKPSFWERRGTLSLMAKEIRVEGIGSLLAQIERLRATLASEGLFAEDRKRPLPFIPRQIGLICGRDAKAKDDVLKNSYLRWPMAQFQIREVAVQGQYAVEQVCRALVDLTGIDTVDVVIIARGGGAVEDLLPFSDERLVRAVAASPKPVISAIGHEGDAPLLDLVADYRASTPTDAARRVVPDFREEVREVALLRSRMHAALRRFVGREADTLNLLANRPVLQRPSATIDRQHAGLEQATMRMRSAVQRRISQQEAEISQLSASLNALSPTGTLERGYAILRTPSKQILRSTAEMKNGMLVEGMVSQGTFVGSIVGTNSKGSFLSPHASTQMEKS